MIYRDSLSRFGESSKKVRSLLVSHLQEAQECNLDIRLVIAKSSKEGRVNAGESGSHPGNSFSAEQNVVGKVTQFDGLNYVIDFVEL